jgi:hypothetical protein
MVDVNPKDLAEKLIDILRSIPGIIPRSSITHIDVKITVGPELDHPAVVVCKRLGDNQRHSFCGIGNTRVRARNVILGYNSRAVWFSRVVYKETTVVSEERMKGKP